MSKGLACPMALSLALTLAGCGTDFLGAPPRIGTDGFRALASIEEEGGTVSFDLAVRGADIRRDLGNALPWPVLVAAGSPRQAFELDPASKRFRKLDPSRLPPVLPDFPLSPGFSEHREAARRGITEFYRESDTVFAGNACQIWRFEDRPGEPGSPATTYWVAPALDGLVVRVDWDRGPSAGARQKRTIERRNVRPGAKPDLSSVPAGYTEAPAPAAVPPSPQPQPGERP